ncbi:MAG: hypothetical protein OEN20_08025 [Gammaproteobacteria bacterium]|nr:hypothetical protein [Gammaproteobacteria bacterium]
MAETPKRSFDTSGHGVDDNLEGARELNAPATTAEQLHHRLRR